MAQKNERAQDFGIVLNPVTKKKSLRISWQSYKKFPWTEWNFVPPVALPDFKEIIFNLKITTSAQCPVRSLNLRLIDGSGEIFQFKQNILWDKAENYEVKYQINVGQLEKADTWGGNQDKKLDPPVRLFGMSAVFVENSGPGEFFIDAISYDYPEPATSKQKNAIQFDVDTGHPLHLLLPDDKNRVKVKFENKSDAQKKINAEITIYDIDAKQCFERKYADISLPSKGSHSVELGFQPEKFGIYYITCRIWGDGNPPSYELRRSFAYMKPVGITPLEKNQGFIFGICSHPDWILNRAIWEQEALAAAIVGAKVLRLDMRWSFIEPRPGEWNFERYDELLNIFTSKGVELAPILFAAPKWAKIGEDEHPDFEPWREYLRRVFARYNNRIHFYEVWNEPDIMSFAKFDVPAFEKLARIARDELDRSGSKALLLSSGFCSFISKNQFHERAITQCKDIFDIHAFHGHSMFGYFYELIEKKLLPMRRKNNIDIPWYANETALSSSGYSEKTQAFSLFKKMLYSWSRGSIGYNWYCLRNKGDNPGNPEHNYGMLTSDFYPKAVYVCYNMLASIYKGKKFIRQLPAADGVWLLEFKDADETTIAAWTEDFSSRQIPIRSNASKAFVVDSQGNGTTLNNDSGICILPVGSSPVSLRLIGATSCEMLPSHVTLANTPVIIPGQNNRLELKLVNASDKQHKFRLKLAMNSMVVIHPDIAEITVGPKSEKIWQTTIKTSAEYSAQYNDLQLLEVNYVLDKSRDSSSLTIPLQFALNLSRNFKREPDFTLNNRSQVYSYFDADPGNVSKLWKSSADLSAKIYIAVNDSTLLLKVDVVDDKFVQPYSGADVWKGDSVQFILDVPRQNGFWELGLSHTIEGDEVYAWSVPEGFSRDGIKKIKLKTSKNGGNIDYFAEIPLQALGITQADLKDGIRFNLLVNDNDENIREGFIRITSGIGDSKSLSNYPLLIILVEGENLKKCEVDF